MDSKFCEGTKQRNEDIGDLKKLSVSKLKSLLTKLVSQENYEKAAKVER